MKIAFPQPIRNGTHRDGVGWRADEIDKWMVAGGWAMALEEHMQPIEETAKGAADKVADVVKAYNESISKFRGETKNDIAAISAAADKVQKEVGKMTAAYGATITQLNSLDMVNAINNAERLAAALASIAAVSTKSLTINVGEE